MSSMFYIVRITLFLVYVKYILLFVTERLRLVFFRNTPYTVSEGF